ncbi:MAG: M20/M25/M40 family metallo-hydrolase [Schleiferiaceae bacterium]
MTVRNTSIRLASGLLLPLLFGATLQLQAQDAPKLSKQALQLQTDVKTLADDAMEGRKVGTKGEKKASEYLVKRFKEMGLNGAISDSKTPYFDPFEAQPSVHGTPTGPKITGRNVVAVLPGQGEGTIYIGAHYDHWGWGGEGSLYRGADSAIHNGADDNASGVAAVLELARRFHDSPLQNTVVFIAFSGEEMGLWGSNAFAKEHLGAFPAPRFMVNMDMVGRLNAERQLAVYGTGTSPMWDGLLDEQNNYGFALKREVSGVGPSDHTSFYLADIPVLHFFTGQHEDYHRPSDDWDKINYAGLADVVDYIEGIVRSADALGELPFSKTKHQSEDTPRFKVTLGVVPDYLYSDPGMRIDGVSEGRPAAKAGLQKGDIVTQMGDQAITSMMDYMKALSTFTKGQTVPVTIQRNGASKVVDVTFD